jgi:PEP-CTERM motif
MMQGKFFRQFVSLAMFSLLALSATAASATRLMYDLIFSAQIFDGALLGPSAIRIRFEAEASEVQGSLGNQSLIANPPSLQVFNGFFPGTYALPNNIFVTTNSVNNFTQFDFNPFGGDNRPISLVPTTSNLGSPFSVTGNIVDLFQPLTLQTTSGEQFTIFNITRGVTFSAVALPPPPPAIPEPGSWALLLAGFGAVGATLRLGRAGRAAQAVFA